MRNGLLAVKCSKQYSVKLNGNHVETNEHKWVNVVCDKYAKISDGLEWKKIGENGKILRKLLGKFGGNLAEKYESILENF